MRSSFTLDGAGVVFYLVRAFIARLEVTDLFDGLQRNRQLPRPETAATARGTIRRLSDEQVAMLVELELYPDGAAIATHPPLVRRSFGGRGWLEVLAPLLLDVSEVPDA
jgi:hypothetical protein